LTYQVFLQLVVHLAVVWLTWFSNSIDRDSERKNEKVDIPHIGRTSSYLSRSDPSSTSKDDGDISNERVIERELKAALQTYADAARMAYIRTQKRFLQNLYRQQDLLINLIRLKRMKMTQVMAIAKVNNRQSEMHLLFCVLMRSVL
jgi:hypothetical protein